MPVSVLPPDGGMAGRMRLEAWRVARHRGMAGALAALWLLGLPQPSAAQQPPPPAAAPQRVATSGQQQALTQAQLERLLAPIALYPDDLLMQVLMASTYPLEVVQAQRWLAEGQNAALRGDALTQALAAQPWDPSVKSLAPFPDVLNMMNQQLDWTQQLGDAVLAQQQDVMNAVQVLRGRAQAAGTLQSGPQQTVNVTQVTALPPPPPAPGVPPPAVAPPPQVITIAPTQPEVVYVPAYDPNVVYGTWPYPQTPPYYYPPPAGWGVGNALLTGMAFATGAAVVGSLWGWASPAWGRGNIDVNVNRYNNINVNRAQINNNVWQHDVSHRHGVAYSNDTVRNRVGADRPGVDGVDRTQARDQLRGRMDQAQPGGGPGGDRQGLGAGRPGGDGAGPGGNRPGGGGDRPGAGGGRPGGDGPPAGARPDGGNRPGGGAGAGRPGGGDGPSAGARPGSADRPGGGGARPGGGDGPTAGARPGGGGAPQRPNAGQGTGAQRPAAQPRPAPQGFQGMDQGGRDRAAAQRGAASRQAMPGSAGGGRGGGGARGGGGGGGGGRRR